MPALGIRPAISLSLKLLTFRWGKIARFALSGVKSTGCWLCAAFFWGGISDIFFRLFFLWYQRDALCTQIFGCEVETVLMLKGGFCLWGRPPLILRDIQAVSPATYEYGGTVPAFRFFSRHEVSESAHSVYFIFLSFFICFFSRNHAVFNPVEFYFPFPFLSFLFRRIPESAYPFRLRETDGKSVRLHFALVPLCVLLFFWLFVFS